MQNAVLRAQVGQILRRRDHAHIAGDGRADCAGYEDALRRKKKRKRREIDVSARHRCRPTRQAEGVEHGPGRNDQKSGLVLAWTNHPSFLCRIIVDHTGKEGI
jgi:hypothetical protein